MNRKKSLVVFGILAVLYIVIGIWTRTDELKSYRAKDAQIILYGEQHGIKEFYEYEFKEWQRFYEEEGMRDLFLELPYYTAEFLNLWMQEEDDAILDEMYADTEGTASHTQDYLDFFRKIKESCPETVFHGTDVGHQFEITGARYLAYLEEKGLTDSEKYELALANMEQGKEWYEKQDPVDWDWREEKMIENFLETYERIGRGKIMGIYGGAHVDVKDGKIMAGAIKDKYGDVVSGIYLFTEILKERTYRIGFSHIGMLFLMMLFIPNMIWAKHQPKDYENYVKNENKVLLLFEKTGEVLVTLLAFIFPALNPVFYAAPYGMIFPARIYYLVLACVCMLLYEGYWIRYFKSEKTMKDMYRDFAGVPLAGATLPVMAFALLAVYSQNLLLLIAVVVLGVGHIGIHYQHFKEVWEDAGTSESIEI